MGMGRAAALVSATVLTTGLLPVEVDCQVPDLTWYLLNVATASEPTPFSGGGLTDDTRFRGMLGWARGEVRLDVAYEHTLGLWENDPLNSNLIFGAAGGTGDWLGLQGNISSWDGGTWSHRVDRLSLSLPLGADGELKLGRQAVSWATTLFLTPADPFAPFDPANPFREYRIGVDAARLHFYPGPFSELDVVVRPSRQAEGTTLTALARGRRSVSGWDVSGWVGVVHDEPGAAGGVSGSAGEWAVRGEASLRRDRAGEGVVLRMSTGVDRLFGLAGRDLYVLAEYQHDGWGASTADSLLTVIQSAPFDRGEMQVLGMDTGLAQMSYQVHPLVAADGLVMLNLRDGSGLFAPGVNWSVASDWSLRGGLYLGWGEGFGPVANPLGSEYGVTPAAGYLSLTAFF